MRGLGSHGYFFYSEQLGYLARWEAFDVAQDDGGALGFGQDVEAFQEEAFPVPVVEFMINT